MNRSCGCSGLSGQYDPPSDFRVPNPLGPRVHNWKGDSFNEGSLYHGPVYTRPSYNLPWAVRPLFGVGQEDLGTSKGSMLGAVLPIVAIGGLMVLAFWPAGGRKQ